SILQDFHYQVRVLVGSVYGKYLHNIRRLEPGIATGASLGEVIDYQVLYRFQGLDYWPFPFQVLMVPENRGPFPLVSKNWIKEAHRQRLKVYIWTINQIEDMKRLLQMGVDGIITDYLDRLAGLFGG
ncbi:MAG TPA: hypothetical protein GX711_05390, partial [Clostridia bacterium]|nr:hypothetical protein [Clostridia bacterium]